MTNTLTDLTKELNELRTEWEYRCACELMYVIEVKRLLGPNMDIKVRNVLITAGRQHSFFKDANRVFHEHREKIREELRAVGLDDEIIRRMTTFKQVEG